MVKITLTDENIDKTVEMEGKAVVAFVINPNVEGEEKPDAASLVLGSGGTKELMYASAKCPGSVVTQIVKDPLSLYILSKGMVEQFKDAVLGLNMDVDVQESEVRKREE